MIPSNLSQNELEALRVLWEKGELKPGQVQEAFAWPIENATLRSTLVTLVEKKLLIRRLEGKAFFYSARVPKASLLQLATRSLARVFAGGSLHGLVAQLVETGDIKAVDLEQIRAAAAGAKHKKRGGKRS